MPFVDYNYVENSSTGTSTLTFAMGKTIPSGAGIVGWIDIRAQGATLNSLVDDQGNTYNVKQHVSNGAGNGSDNYLFILGNITNSPATFTANLAANVTIGTVVLVFHIYTGWAALGDPTDGASQNIFSMQAQQSDGTLATFTAPSITPVDNGCLIFAFTYADYAALAENWAGNTVSPGAGFTGRVNNVAHNTNFAAEDQTQVTAGAITPTFTISPAYQNFGQEITGAIAIKLAAGGGGGGIPSATAIFVMP